MLQTRTACSGEDPESVCGQPPAKDEHVTCGSNQVSQLKQCQPGPKRTDQDRMKDCCQTFGLLPTQLVAVAKSECYGEERMTLGCPEAGGHCHYGPEAKELASPSQVLRSRPPPLFNMAGHPPCSSQFPLLPSLFLWSHFQYPKFNMSSMTPFHSLLFN